MRFLETTYIPFFSKGTYKHTHSNSSHTNQSKIFTSKTKQATSFSIYVGLLKEGQEETAFQIYSPKCRKEKFRYEYKRL
jgi:hypothetical protein